LLSSTSFFVFQVRRLFAPHGELRRVVLPPTKTICVIEFLEPNEAKKAFRSLAYKKFKTVPLFLEWAPDKMFMSAEEKAQVLEARKQEKAATGTVESKNDDDIPSSTLCIKNLNFDTTEESVRYMFSRIGPITSVKIMQKPNPKKVDQVSKPMLSMGYGFVQFDDPAHALSALQRLQGSELDGHQLVLSKAKRGSVAAEERGKSKRKTTTTNSDILSTTKLLIRNVAFQTTLKEIRELVVPFGKLKQCRLPTKFDGRPRGFAFAEYFSEQEAKQAFEALQHTHLYGRHLVVEWAKEDDDVAQLRAKTVSKFQSGELAAQGIVVAKTGANKRRKVEQLDDADTSFLKQMGSI
jgi:multiple RNA-binding domain-containing protein 1